MPLEQNTRDSSITADKIDTWQDYFLKAKERLRKQCKLFIYTYGYEIQEIIILVKYDMPLLRRSRTGKLFINRDSDVFIPYFHHDSIYTVTPPLQDGHQHIIIHHQKHRTKPCTTA
jgi:hypothetical protein